MRLLVLSVSLGAVVLLAGCTGDAHTKLRENPEFADAARYAFGQFENPEPADLAFAVRRLEREVYLTADVEAAQTAQRALAPSDLSSEDLSDFDQTPGTYPEGFEGEGESIVPENAYPIAVAGLSAYLPDAHPPYLLLEDQTATEPGSPDHYDRSFLEDTELCWPDRSCEGLRTLNDVTKTNALLAITYDMFKDYRWVDLNLPDPASIPEGEAIVNEGPARWALVARSWNPSSALGAAGNNAIFQSYSVEIWVPRDGGGFVRDGSEENAEGGTWESDSNGGGSLRMMALWAESNFGMNSLVEQLTRNGIDDIFVAQDAWLDAHPAR